MTRSLFHQLGRDAFLDWEILTITVLIVAVVLIVVGYNIYRKTNSQISNSIIKSTTVRKPVFDEAQLRSIITRYDEKAAEWNRLQTGYAGTADPSI